MKRHNLIICTTICAATLLLTQAKADDEGISSGDSSRPHPVAAVKHVAKKIGHGVHRGVRAVGHGFRDGARAVGHGASKVTHKVGHSIHHAAREVAGKDDASTGPKN